MGDKKIYQARQEKEISAEKEEDISQPGKEESQEHGFYQPGSFIGKIQIKISGHPDHDHWFDHISCRSPIFGYFEKVEKHQEWEKSIKNQVDFFHILP
jgi:hypothetical protein